MTSPTLPQIVETLSPAERDFMRDGGEWAIAEDYETLAAALVEKGLLANRAMLSGIGLQVRTHLLSLGEGM